MHFRTMSPALPAGFQKTYLSREMSRVYAMDNPVGDPFGGPAYGEKNGPAVAIMLPVFTMAGTYTAMMAGSIMAGVAFAGAAVSLVGTVTGNQKLQRIGAVAGLIGGAGMAGMFGEAAQAATWSSTFGGAEAAAAAPSAALSQTPSAAPGTQTPIVEGVSTAPTADLASPSASYAGGNINAPGGTAAGVNVPGGMTAPLNTAPGAPADMFGTASSAPFDAMGNPTAAASDISLVSSPGAPGVATAGVKPGFTESLQAGNYWDATKAAGSNVAQFTKDYPMLSMMGMQAVSGLSEWMSGKTDAEIDALQAQIGYADARAMQIQEEIAKEKQRRANLNAGYQQVDAGVKVDPSISIPVPWAQPQPQSGLIAGNMPPRG